MTQLVVKVTSPSFSVHPELRAELLRAFPGATFNDGGKRLSGSALSAYLEDANAAVIGLEPVDDALLARCPLLRIIAKYGVGLDNVDLAACERRGVAIGWTGGVNRRSVAELVLAMMIGLSRNLFLTSRQLALGQWNKTGGRSLTGRIVGIIGVGNVGKDLVGLLKPFGCRILVNDIVDQAGFYQEYGLIATSKEEIFRTAEIITLHVPLTELTYNLVNARTLALFRPDAILINAARGGIVDQEALKRALCERRLAAAAIDCFGEEPPTDRELLGLPNLVATPHIGGNANEAVLAMGRSAIGHLQRFFAAGS